jgi:hypothetical protein
MLLHHYTNSQGLLGIANSKSFWATNFLQMNDGEEFFYAWDKIQQYAYDYVRTRIPADLMRPEVHLEQSKEKFLKQARAHLLSQMVHGYEQLYVTSFAEPRTVEQKNNGILTLWDRYKDCRGYCLEYSISRINRILEQEQSSFNYALLSLAPVQYGMIQTQSSFKKSASKSESNGSYLWLKV